MLAHGQQFGHTLTEMREATLQVVVHGRINRVVDVREEVLGVLAPKIIVTNRAVVRYASPGGRGQNGTPK